MVAIEKTDTRERTWYAKLSANAAVRCKIGPIFFGHDMTEQWILSDRSPLTKMSDTIILDRAEARALAEAITHILAEVEAEDE